MRKSTIKIRFSVSSERDNSVVFFDLIKNKIPHTKDIQKKGDYRILSNGRVFPTPNKETFFQYVYEINSNDIIEALNTWISFWHIYFEELKIIRTKYKYKLHLNYEITVIDFNYPSFYLPVKFSSILSNVGIEFSFYFYND